MAKHFNEEATMFLILEGRRVASILASLTTSYITILLGLIRELVVPYLQLVSAYTSVMNDQM